MGYSNNCVNYHVTMKKFVVIPVKTADGTDGNQTDKIELPIGETVVGRGEKFKCFDKKVSRNHCLLRIFENGNVELTSTHTNPCFHQTEDEEWKVLAQSNSILLKKGDKFSLLQDNFQYCLEIIEEHEVEDIDLKVKENENLSSVALEGNQSENETLPNVTPQKKVAHPLPAWMNESVTSTKRKSDNEEVGKKKQKPEKCSPSKENISGSLNCDVDNKTDYGKDDTNSDHKPGNGDEDKDCNNIRTAQNNLHTISDDDENGPESVPVQETTGSVEKVNDQPPVNNEDMHTISDDENDPESVPVQETTGSVEKVNGQPPVNEDVSSNSSVRQPCKYGQGCYRKNPQHLSDFSHPGDSDYKSDDRPECPYGTACYRKNPVHKKDFKHTQTKPAQKKRRKQKATPNGKSSDEDDYDYDDPFLNDGSSDDYEPTDSGSDESWSEGEDEGSLKRLRKEARKFTGKRKQ